MLLSIASFYKKLSWYTVIVVGVRSTVVIFCVRQIRFSRAHRLLAAGVCTGTVGQATVADLSSATVEFGHCFLSKKDNGSLYNPLVFAILMLEESIPSLG